jgi:2-polyprenyl-3-methyl-5-hydroxy-6-metoxy-1,4-benzoquinol methylase
MTTLDEAAVPTSADPDDQGAVADRMVRILNDGAINVLGSIGHQLGLFDTLASLPWSTSTQVADAAGLDERYVREWLGGVVTAGWVDYDPDRRLYRISEDYTPFLTGTGVDNIARTMGLITLMGQVTPLVLDTFRNGGGLSYDDYPGFHDAQAADSAAVNDASLLEVIVPLTGLDDRLRAGIDVADFGCGEGHAVNLLAREYPDSRFWGLDFSAAAIEPARAEAAAWGLTNATFVECDVAGKVDTESYDLVTAFDAIHDQAHPATVLANIRQSLRPGGTFLMVDINASSRLEKNIGLPWGSFLYTVSTVHCMSVSLGQGGDGLGTVWGTELATRMLRDAGFSSVRLFELEQDPFNAYFVSRR